MSTPDPYKNNMPSSDPYKNKPYVSVTSYDFGNNVKKPTKTPTPPPPPPVDNARGRILSEANSLINGDRNDAYGDPIDDFRTTADLWTTYVRRVVDRRESSQLQPHDVAAMMMLLKVSRLMWSPEKRDHWVDAIGYAACGWDCVEREEDIVTGTVNGID